MLRKTVVNLIKTARVVLADLKTKYLALDCRVSVLEKELKKVMSQIDNQRSHNDKKF